VIPLNFTDQEAKRMIPPIPGKPSKIGLFHPKPMPQPMMQSNPNMSKMKQPMPMPMPPQQFMYNNNNNYMQLPPGMQPMTREQLMKLFPHLNDSTHNNKFYTY
jgi:hypothetical protein